MSKLYEYQCSDELKLIEDVIDSNGELHTRIFEDDLENDLRTFLGIPADDDIVCIDRSSAKEKRQMIEKLLLDDDDTSPRHINNGDILPKHIITKKVSF